MKTPIIPMAKSLRSTASSHASPWHWAVSPSASDNVQTTLSDPRTSAGRLEEADSGFSRTSEGKEIDEDTLKELSKSLRGPIGGGLQRQTDERAH